MIAILLVLTGLVVILYNSNFNSERIRGAARQTQSILLGAQSRAALKKEPVGIRLVLDQNDPTVATGFVYIGPTREWREGTLQIGREDDDDNGIADGMATDPPRVLRGSGTGWDRLYNQNLLVDGARIRIPSNGATYTVQVDSNDVTDDPPILRLYTDFKVAPVYAYDSVPAHNPMDYILELQPTLLPDEQPVLLPSGIVIDLYNSRIPRNWYGELIQAGSPGSAWRKEAGSGATTVWRRYFPQKMDILFSPRGMVTGSLAAQGIVHLVLADTFDTDQQRHPVVAERENLIVTLFTRTGAVSSHPIDKLGPDALPGKAGIDDDGNGTTDDDTEIGAAGSDDYDDPARYAETGSVAGK